MWIIPACCCCPPFIGWRKTSSSTVLEWNKKERPQRKAASNSRFLRLLHRKKSRNQAHRIETHKNTHRSRSLLASIETNFVRLDLSFGQVWPLTFEFLFCEKSSICQEGKSMIPHRGEHYPLPILPATPSSPSRTLEGFFEVTWHPSRALDSPRALLAELQRCKDTVRCAALGAEV